MIETTLEWHRTSDQLPDDDALVIAADSDGDTFAAFVNGDAWRYADAIPAPTPEFWAQFPDGPEAEPKPQTCKAGLQVARRPLTPAQEGYEAELTRLRAECEAYKTDAERYRFVRDADRSDCITRELSLYAMESLDQCVDAAMEDEAALAKEPT